MTERFTESRATAEDFGHEFLVSCPRCASRALVRDRGPDAFERRIVLSCATCGHADVFQRTQPGVRTCADPTWFETGAVGIGAPVDWYFHLPLWLQAPCCGEVLWAWNAAHLDFLERYVRAQLRERVPSDEHGWSNRSLVSRMPRWISAAKNRSAVLATIARLRERVP
ncbi:MAG: TFIIB-type zinc ribbon-containing protein [Gemmatimonadota bacterium]